MKGKATMVTNEENSNSGIREQHTPADLEDENRRIRYLRRLVDFTLAFIAQSNISMEEARRSVQAVREQAHRLFPDKDETFELIYMPRFRRLIAEKYRLV